MQTPTTRLKKEHKPIISKSSLFILLIALIAIQNNIRPLNYKFDCFYDLLTEIVIPAAKRLQTDKSLRNALILISSLLIDLTILSTTITWVFMGKSWRLLLTMVSFYSIRGVLQFIYTMPFSKYYSFEYPGFPSLMVSYLKTNDFFYSGHVAIPLMCGIEHYSQGRGIITIITVIVSLYQGLVLILTHSHFGIDVIIGMMCAHYFSKVTDKYIKSVDQSWISIDENRETNNATSEYLLDKIDNL